MDGGRFPDVPARPIEPIRPTDGVACERRGLAVRGGGAAASRAAAVGARGDVRGDGDSTSRSARIGGVGAEYHLGVSGPRRVVRAQVHVRRVIVLLVLISSSSSESWASWNSPVTKRPSMASAMLSRLVKEGPPAESIDPGLIDPGLPNDDVAAKDAYSASSTRSGFASAHGDDSPHFTSSQGPSGS